jgi:hypothetical protein
MRATWSAPGTGRGIGRRGSGVTGQVCVELGRRVILADKDEHWYRQAIRRCQHRAPERVKVEKPLPLFEKPQPRQLELIP